MRQIDLSSLPKRIYGSRVIYDWANSPRSILPFVYDDVEGFIEIIDYIKSDGCDGKLVVKFGDSTKSILPINLRRCKIGDMVGKQSRNFLFEVGETIKDSKRDMTIIELIRKKASKYNARYIRYKCNVCGYESSAVPEDSFVRDSSGCGSCCGKVLVRGINDITTTAPWMVAYFQGREKEARNYTANSGKKLEFVCIHCGKALYKKIPIRNLHRRGGLNCCCRQKQSYPEKFMWNVLHCLGLKFEYRFTASWLKGFNDSNYPCEFDFFLPDYKIIIEMDGSIGHGKYVFPSNKLSAEETKLKDAWKDIQAEAQGISVVRIESDESNLEYLSCEINKSLGGIFDLSGIDWVKCHSDSLHNAVKEISAYYETNKPICLSDLAKRFNVSKKTIRRYLDKGTMAGWCEFDADLSKDLRKTRVAASMRECANKIREEIIELYERDKTLSKIAIAKALSYHRGTVGKHLNEYIANQTKCNDYGSNPSTAEDELRLEAH